MTVKKQHSKSQYSVSLEYKLYYLEHMVNSGTYETNFFSIVSDCALGVSALCYVTCDRDGIVTFVSEFEIRS